ncbi:patatin-like phospholipase family protein [Massilia sp. NR 4-1]|uniref:patatin-like phospholipase family protein n=1 Tax=Massilia sp. NR 4-1 TaxID=1678028 RepID=UPI000B04E0D0|nr:patatin-like phospholipase family protein [Massilia sp. NR 4-1]
MKPFRFLLLCCALALAAPTHAQIPVEAQTRPDAVLLPPVPLPRTAAPPPMPALLPLAVPAASAPAQNLRQAPADGKRPRVALVLSGGGARGFAHIGVLRVLQEMQVPIDIVVGTSMGSVVGGAFAAGASVEELEHLARKTDWNRVMADRSPRDELSFRRREEDVRLPSRLEFGISKKGATLPPAAASNAALEMALDRLLPSGTRDTAVDQLPLPFRSVASDLVTGELVDLKDTPLFLSMRASLAVPGVFAPVRINHRLVVDGGLVRNLPVDLARDMGADVVIAVNVGTPLAPESELDSALDVANQMLQILTEQNVQRSLKELRAEDILIAPDLSGISFLDFELHDNAMKAGMAAARALAPRLAHLALNDGDFIAFERRRLAPPALDDHARPLGKVEIAGQGEINPAILRAQSGLVQGQPFTKEQIRDAAASLYGRGDLARVETEIHDRFGERNVLIRTSEAEWTRNRVRVGLELQSDFQDSNSFALKLLHVSSSLNRWGGELLTDLRIGKERALGVQFWQPLGEGSRWYISPTLQYNSTGADLFNEGRRMARLTYSKRSALVSLGRELGNWGDVQAGVTRQRFQGRAAVPEDLKLPFSTVFGTAYFMRFRVDTVDSLAFPTRGTLLDANYSHPIGEDAVLSSASSSVTAMRAFTSGPWSGHVYGEWARARTGAAPLNLGGFMRLSGTPAESVQGQTVAFSRVVMARRFDTLGNDVRVGFSLEAGGGFDRVNGLRSRSVMQAGSVFLSLDTRAGPIYLGGGATKGGYQSLYLFLGPIW